MRPIGYVRNAYTDTSQIPKGLGASHTAAGILEINADLEEIEKKLLQLQQDWEAVIDAAG